MSVLVTVSFEGDPKRLEEQAGANPDVIRGITDRARSHGLVAHRFYGNDEGRIMVVDEWPDEQSFQAFFEAGGSDIEGLLGAAGVTAQPQVAFWRALETHDEVGWE